MPCPYIPNRVRDYAFSEHILAAPIVLPESHKFTNSVFESNQRLHDKHKAEEDDIIAACRPRAKLGHLAKPPNARNGRMTGRDRLAILQKTLDSFGLLRSKNQREFHREMMKAVLPLIFKDDLNENLDDLLREFEATELKSEVMIITPRRWGKVGGVPPPSPPAFFELENVD